MADSTNGNNISTLAFKIDVGDAKNNLKDYKDYMDGLKGTLLELEKGTDKYNEVAKELKDSQQKLNEVMDVAKGKGEAVEGSYDNLSQTMSKLKKEFKATGDEAERASLATRINDINDQLKQMDASVGVFSRNVGNYSQAYQAAFSELLKDTSKMDGLLGTMSKDLKGLIPIIQKTTSTATAGLSGIKKAIAATGIGLLVIALGELVKHFDDLRRAVGITDEKFQDFKDKTLNVFRNIVAAVVGAGNALLQFLIAPIKSFIEVVKGAGQLIKDVFTGNFKAIKDDAKSAGEAVNNALNNGIQFKANYLKGKEFADNLINNIKDNVSKSGPVTVDVEVKLKEVDLSKIDNFIDPAIKARVEAEKQALKEQEELNALSAALDKEAYDAALDALGDFNEKFIQEQKEKREEEERLNQERIDSYFSMAGSISSILGTVADAWLDTIQSQIDAGKMSEAEGKRQFQRIKSLQMSETIINTLAGMTAALTAPSLQSAGPFGWAAAAAQAASILATGIAQVTKIQNTQFGSKSVNGTNITTPNLGNLVNQYNPTYTQNITNNTEMDALANALHKNPIKAYVVESDITYAQNLSNQRKEETTF